jgi:hypothetical protein
MQLAQLNRSAEQVVKEAAIKNLEMPPLVKQVLEAENKLRSMLYTASTSYEQMEAVAVLAGMAPLGEGSKEIPSGRWSLHPDGYYIKYDPQGYTNTKVTVWVPQGSPAVGKEYDPSTHIAVPGNTARQRLVQSGRAYTD